MMARPSRPVGKQLAHGALGWYPPKPAQIPQGLLLRDHLDVGKIVAPALQHKHQWSDPFSRLVSTIAARPRQVAVQQSVRTGPTVELVRHYQARVRGEGMC